VISRRAAPNVGAIVRMGKYLTRRGNSFVFQLRPPKSIDPDFRLSPIRVTLGAITGRSARRLASILTGCAYVIFSALERRDQTMSTAPISTKEIQKLLLQAAPLFVGLDAAAEVGSQNDTMAKLMIETGIDGLIGLSFDKDNGGYLGKSHGRALQDHFVRVIKDEPTARAYLGLEPLPPKQSDIEKLVTNVEQMRGQLETLSGNLEPKHGPLFSVAGEAYHEKLTRAKGNKKSGKRYREPGYVLHRKNAFLQLMEDKPVDMYSEEDIQNFVNEIQFLDPNYDNREDYDITRIKEFIAENKEQDGPRLSYNTIHNNYLPRIFAIIRHGCKMGKVRYPLDDCKIVYAPEVPKPRNQIPADYSTLNRIFRKGVATGVLLDTLLPPLGYVVGRRLGILTYLHRDHIRPYHGSYIVAPRDVIVEHNSRLIVPFKTLESLQFYVLNDKFVEWGLVDWMLKQEGFIFKQLHESAEDPAGAASKRMKRLFKGEADPALYQTFHALRHGRKNEDIDHQLAPAASRMQAGRAAANVDDLYGQGHITPNQVRMIANAPLAPEIDWSIFRNLNWDQIGRTSRWPRNFAKKWSENAKI
jgi:hypothetical protein